MANNEVKPVKDDGKTHEVILEYLKLLGPGWCDPWILKITDTVPPEKRRQYQKDIRQAIPAIILQVGPSLVHLGSFQVAFGRALEFMHLFAIPDLKTYEDLMKAKPNVTFSAAYNSGTLDSKTACGHVHHIYITNKTVTDSHWELLKPDNFCKTPEDPKKPKPPKKATKK